MRAVLLTAQRQPKPEPGPRSQGPRELRVVFDLSLGPKD